MKKYFGILVIMFSMIFVSFETKKEHPINNETTCFRCNNEAMITTTGNNPNDVHHIMLPKHAWNRLYSNPTWKKVSRDILTVLNNGPKAKFGKVSGVYRKIYVIKGFHVEVIFREYSNKNCTLSDAWVKPKK